MHGLVPNVKLMMPPTWRQFPLHTLWALRLKLLGAGEHRRAELVQRRIQKLQAREARRSTTQPNRRRRDRASVGDRSRAMAGEGHRASPTRRTSCGDDHQNLTSTPSLGSPVSAGDPFSPPTPDERKTRHEPNDHQDTSVNRTRSTRPRPGWSRLCSSTSRLCRAWRGTRATARPVGWWPRCALKAIGGVVIPV